MVAAIGTADVFSKGRDFGACVPQFNLGTAARAPESGHAAASPPEVHNYSQFPSI
jgi:hypothetical protein